MPSPPTKRRVLVQAGHNKPLQPGHEGQTGAQGEAELVARIQKRLMQILKGDSRFESVAMPGLIPKGTKADAAVFLHGDGAGPTATGFSFGFPDAAVNKKLANFIAAEFAKIPGHPHRRQDNGTVDAHHYYGFGLVASQGPETLIEHGFLSNPTERQWLQRHVPQLARAEYVAICRFFGLMPAEPGGTPSGETLTANSTILAAPRASAAQMRQHLINRHRAHPGQSRLKDKTLADIINLYVKICKSVGVDPLVAVSQMELETGHLTSKASQPPRRNPAGIGITSASAQGVSFPTWNKAVRAHVGRLAAYAIPKGAGTQAQKALIAEALAVRPLPDSKRGSALRLKGLSHNWAEDRKYAHKIGRIAKEIHA
jgi:N-acetylmuramoyl-L-alanine amidase-like protein/mannosyl-glycoprotein endo-beta-N-acetylglucosaminidase